MATHDYVIDNASGSAVRTDLNNVLQAILTNNSSGSAPSTTAAYMLWADTSNNILKMRNSANNAWIELFQLDGTLTLEDGSASTPALAFRDDLNSGIFSSAADTVDVSCGGTARGSFSSSGLAVTGNVTATSFVGNVDAVDGDFDGTLEADAITVAGVALNTVIAGVASTNVTVADESSDTTCFPLFVTAATGDLPPKSGSNLAFNASNGTLTATAFAGDGSNLTGLASGGVTSDSDGNTIGGTGAGASFQTQAGAKASSNTLFGKNAGTALTTGDQNVAIGLEALKTQTTVSFNVAVGSEALKTNSSGTNNVAVGYQALRLNDTSLYNTAVGYQAMTNNVASRNTAVGQLAMSANTSGAYNCAFGVGALNDGQTGNYNNAIGYRAGRFAEGTTNDLHGTYSGDAITSGNNNVCNGYHSGTAITTGYKNQCYGAYAGKNITTGSDNSFVGNNTQGSSATTYNEIVIGHSLTGKGAGTGMLMGNVYNSQNQSSFQTTSDKRIKKNIVDNNIGLSEINKIQVRNFEYRKPEEVDSSLPSHAAVNKEGVQLGVIAQEIQKIFPDVVTEETTGCLSVNPDNLTWYLVNAVKELSAKVTALEAG